MWLCNKQNVTMYQTKCDYVANKMWLCGKQNVKTCDYVANKMRLGSKQNVTM